MREAGVCGRRRAGGLCGWACADRGEEATLGPCYNARFRFLRLLRLGALPRDGGSVPGRRQAHVIRARAPSGIHTARTSCCTQAGGAGQQPLGGFRPLCPLSRQEMGAPINDRGTCRSPTLPSSLPTRGEGMHQPGFTHFSSRCLGSEGAIRPRDWLPVGLLPVAFTSLGVSGGEVSREGERPGSPGFQPSGMGHTLHVTGAVWKGIV